MPTLKVVRSSTLQKRKTTIGTEHTMAEVKKISERRRPSPFITQQDLDACGPVSKEEQAWLRDSRARVVALLASPNMSPDVLRAKADRAARWEERHGPIKAFVGKLEQ